MIEGEQVIPYTAEDEAAEEAAFEATFNGTDVEPVQTQNAAEETPIETPAETEVPAETATTPELTITDLKAMIEAERAESQKLRDKVFGKVGELKQRIDAIKSTAHGISPKAKEKLSKEFPELAEMLFEDAPEPTPEPTPEPAVTPAPTINPLSIEMRLLKRDHKDWEQVVVSQEFSDWKSTVLSMEEANALDESSDADFVSEKITQFKQWKQDQVKKEADEKKKQERLEAAIIPKGIPKDSGPIHNDDDEETEMLKAFNSRKR